MSTNSTATTISSRELSDSVQTSASDATAKAAGATSAGGNPTPAATISGRYSWQAAAQVRHRELEREVAWLERTRRLDEGAATSLRDELAAVATMISARDERRPVTEWLRGSRIEVIWQTLHSVERELVAFRPREALEGALPGIVGSAQRFLPKNTLSVEVAAKWMKDEPDDVRVLRNGVRTLLEESHAASDAYYAAVRTLRNRMLALSLTAVLGAAVMVVVQWRMPTMPIVQPPKAFSGTDWQLLVLIMFFGAVGAFVTGLVPMLKTASGFLPYKLPFQQGLLKVAVGPLAAVVGLVFVVGGLTGTKPEGLPGLFAIAVVFGAAQQAITGFADRSAAEMLAKKESPATT